MAKVKDLTGERFGRLVVMERAGSKNGRAAWLCRCDCGGEKVVSAAELSKGSTRSCGCLGREQRKQVARRQCHDFSRANMMSERKTWENMIARCHYPKHRSYYAYGANGVEVCPQWRESFEQFVRDMGRRPAGHTIDRIDSTGDYTPENCRWADIRTQANNKKSNRRLTHDGETLTVSQWAERVGMKTATLFARLRLGWSVHRALTEPVKPQATR